MIIFDQLRISDNGSKLYINLHVNKAKYFENMYLDNITIMTADQVSEMAPETATDNYIYKYVFEGENKEADMVLTPADFNEKFNKGTLSSDLFFVYVKCKGVPDPCTPCTLDEQTTLGVTFDETVLYQMIMNLTKEIANTCEIPQNMLDIILLWNGFKASIETEHYIQAIKFWKNLFRSTSEIVYKGCGCHG